MSDTPSRPSLFNDLAETFADIRHELPLTEGVRDRLVGLRRDIAAYLDAMDRLLAVDGLVRAGVEVDRIELAKVAESISP